MRKFLVFFFGAIQVSASVEISPPLSRAKLHIECVVEPEVKVRRTDGGKDLDMLKGDVATFEVEANTTDGVDVALVSGNEFHLKNDSDVTIPFDSFIRIDDKFEKMMGEGSKRMATISQDHFIDRKCTFALKCIVSGDLVSGQYQDTMTLQITAH